MTPKTIAFLLPNLGGGGAERVAIRLMHSFREAGHRVEFVLMQRTGELLDELPEDVRVVDLGAVRTRQALRPLVRYIRSARPDGIQASMWPLTVIAILARRIARSNARLVVSDHAALSRHYARQWLTLAALRSTVRLFYPAADARVLVSAGAADDLARLSGLPRSSFEVIYNPVGNPPSDERSQSGVEALWGDATARLLTVGTLKAQKNHALLIRSLARLPNLLATRLVILGRGPLEAELKQLAASLGLGARVVFAGFASHPWPYYQAADLFILSSDYEGFGNVLVEAMRCGLPVVATDCESGPAEILDHGRFGRLVPVGDEAALAVAISQSLDQPPAPNDLVDRAEELSGAGAAQAYLKLLVP